MTLEEFMLGAVRNGMSFIGGPRQEVALLQWQRWICRADEIARLKREIAELRERLSTLVLGEHIARRSINGGSK